LLLFLWTTARQEAFSAPNKGSPKQGTSTACL
jgi:hypothetical protein